MFCRFPIALTLAVAWLIAAPPVSLAQSTAHAPTYGEKIQIHGVHNAGKVSAVLFRGNQPQAPAFVELKKLGVTTVVDLRGEDPGRVAWERQQAESIGLRFIHIPVSGWSPPANEQVSQFLSLFRENPQQKVFVHCRFGDDRTGVFVATYRIAIDHWPTDRALNEMYFFGFNGFWHPAMKSFIRDFPARLSKDPRLASLATPNPSGPAASN